MRLPMFQIDAQFCMDFPSRPPTPTTCTEALVRALGKRPLEVH